MSTEPNNVTAPASGPPDLSKYSGAAWAKFIILSGFGIFVFFINITLPAYTNPFSGWETASRHTMLITHLSDFIRHSLWTGSIKAMPAIIWLFGVYCLWDIFKVNPAKAWKTTSVNKVFSVFKCIGFVLVTFTAINFYTSTFNSPGTGAEGVALWAAIPGTGWAPAFMGWYFEPILVGARSMAISPFVLSSILVMVTITIPLAAAFLPFLTNYGLVDFFGVFMRGVMRPLFKLPGRASVISVSALLASFVVAFIGAATEYNTGKMTQKEAMIIAYGLSSASIGFLFVLGANTGIMHIWNLYLWPAFFLVLIVTVIVVRIPPLSMIPNTYKEGVTPNPEVTYAQYAVKNAFNNALQLAENPKSFWKEFIEIMKSMRVVLGNVATGSTLFATVGLALYYFTPIIEWTRWIFFPLMRIFLGAEEALVGGAGAVLSFIEITLPTLLVVGSEPEMFSMMLRYMLAMIPIGSIIFIAAWVPTVLAMPLPVKFSHIVVSWFFRMILSILFTGAFALLLQAVGVF